MASAEKEAEAASAARKIAEESAKVTKGLAEKSATIEARIAEHETQLADLKSQCDDRLKTIEGLLPGATSAGLAHSFNQRRQNFLEPQKKWDRLYVGSVMLIAVLAVANWLLTYQGNASLTWDEIWLLWLSRLPVAAPFIWLALHASREAALAKRLEEDYGFKAAASSCFEGYRRQMSEIPKGVEADSPLGKLCADTLATIASPPGRIYDKHELTVSPAGELTEAAKGMADVVKGPKA